MLRTALVLAAAVACVGCSTEPRKSERNFTATSLTVDQASIGRQVLAAVPAESAMERFELIDRQGRRVSYVAFTDTDFGGLLFFDDKLHGMLSKRDARAFYSCRGYVSATRHHWARDAADWTDALSAAAAPRESATLDFSGKTTMQSIKEVVRNPLLSDVRSLVDMGSNPFSIFRTLNSAHTNMVEREKFEKTMQALGQLMPGDSEDKVARIVRPEDISFTSDGMVMAYPRFSLDFYVSDGAIKVLQQPSFHRLSRLHAAIFYVPNLHWDRCTPSHWRTALPEDWKPPTEEEAAGAATETAAK